MRRGPRRRRFEQPDNNEPRVNRRIRVPRVLVIDEDGAKLGEFLTEDALKLAEDRGLDLIEVAPNGRPPVCKIADFGQLKYERKKREAQARRNQVQVQLKEVKLRPKTDEHDLAVKLKHSRRFLEEGNKVKVTVRFRGRELAHRDIGAERCLMIAGQCEDLATIEAHPRMDGRQMFMILAPLKRKEAPPPKERKKRTKKEGDAEGDEDEFTDEAEYTDEEEYTDEAEFDDDTSEEDDDDTSEEDDDDAEDEADEADDTEGKDEADASTAEPV